MLTIILHSLPSWALLVSLSFCIGIPVFRLGILPSGFQSGGGIAGDLSDRMHRLLGLSLIVLVAGSVLELFVRTSEMSGTDVKAMFLAVPTVLGRTHYGLLWIARAAVIGALWGAWRATRVRPASRKAPMFILSAAALIAMTMSATGHAAGQGDFTLPEAADWLHLMAAMLWAGGTFTLVALVIPVASRMPENGKVLADIQRRYSRIVYGVLMSVLALTAWYNAWMSAQTIPALLSTASGRTIAAKIVLSFGMLAAGSLAEWYGGEQYDRWLGRFRKAVRVQAIVMLAILFCAAMLRHQVPARHQLMMLTGAGMAGGMQHQGHGSGSHLGHDNSRDTGAAEPEVIAKLKTLPEAPKAGAKTSLLLLLSDAGNRPVTGLTITHDRLVHVVIVGSDLETFAHIHPDETGPITAEMKQAAAFRLEHVFPRAGEYLMAVDTAVNDIPVARTLRVRVSGSPALTGVKRDLRAIKRFGPYTVELASESKVFQSGKETLIAFRIKKNGAPVTDLESYLSAPMHIAVVRADLGSFLHTHGMVPGAGGSRDAHGHVHMDAKGLPKKFGPRIEARVVFETPGLYKIFGEVMHEGRVVVVDFMVEVK